MSSLCDVNDLELSNATTLPELKIPLDHKNIYFELTQSNGSVYFLITRLLFWLDTENKRLVRDKGKIVAFLFEKRQLR